MPGTMWQWRSIIIEARRILKDVRGIAFTNFDASDVVRHPLVARIVAAYEKASDDAAKARHE